jgi:hypothetical protein
MSGGKTMSGSRRTPSRHCHNRLSTVRADVKLAEPTRSFSNLNCNDAFDPDSAPEDGVSRLDEKDQPFFSKTRTYKGPGLFFGFPLARQPYMPTLQ